MHRAIKETIEMIEMIQAVTEKYESYAAHQSSVLISLLRISVQLKRPVR